MQIESNIHEQNQIICYPTHLLTHHSKPILNKLISTDNHLFCGYSNGSLLKYNFNIHNDRYSLQNVLYPYQNTDIIDLALINCEMMLCCTHNEVTILNMEKNKTMALKGHQQSIISVSAHPISPLVVSVSNLVIHHDLRIRKPISVNFITPPVYGVTYFYDGEYYLLSGDPCRIGKDSWVRTLLQGMGTVSPSSKFILTNQMDGRIVLWDWRKSEMVKQLHGVANLHQYQPIYFGLNQANIESILFLQDDGYLLQHNLQSNETIKDILLKPKEHQNWKMCVINEQLTTKGFVIYEHSQAIIKCYNL